MQAHLLPPCLFFPRLICLSFLFITSIGFFPPLNLIFPLLFLFLSSPFSPMSSSYVKLCKTRLGFMPCTVVKCVSCQVLSVQGYYPGTGALARAKPL